MTRLPSLPFAACRRKALVALLVLGAHAWLVSLRFPALSRDPRPGEAIGRISVQLIPATGPAPTVQPPGTAPVPAAAGRSRVRPRGRVATPSVPSTPDSSAAPTGREAAAGTETLAVQPLTQRPIVPGAPALQLPPTLAERAQARIGPGTGVHPLQRGIEGSARPDCKQVYAGLVLLAIPALLRDALRDDGCKW